MESDAAGNALRSPDGGRQRESLPVYVLDFEGSLKSGVVEYGVVCLESEAITSVQTGMCCPERAQDPREVLLHGLRDEQLREQPRFETLRAQFHRFRQQGLLAAHHAVVENGFLSRYWHTVPTGQAESHAYPSLGSWGPWIDSRLVYRDLFPDLPDLGLMTLIRQFALMDRLQAEADRACPADRRKPHCALYDALASALLLLRVQEVQGLGVDDWVRCSRTARDDDRAQQEWF